MWNPSRSWSDMIMILPYRSLSISLMVNPSNSPNISMRSLYSLLCSSCCTDASPRLSGFPLRGYTPNFSDPMTLSPLMANVLAESPSVRIKVHCADLALPAHLASSSLGLLILRFLALLGFPASCSSSMASLILMTRLVILHLRSNSWMNSEDILDL